jgi:hypothetical protein
MPRPARHVAEIGNHVGRTGEVRGDGLEGALGAGGEDDRRALPGEQARRRGPNAAAGSDHECNLVVEHSSMWHSPTLIWITVAGAALARMVYSLEISCMT